MVDTTTIPFHKFREEIIWSVTFVLPSSLKFCPNKTNSPVLVPSSKFFP